MTARHMVRVAATRSGFEAKVLAARLGADGVLTELRGSVDGLYPVGVVEVCVPADEFDRACALLLADDVETAFDDDHDVVAVSSGARSWPFAVSLVVAMAVFLALRVLAAAS